MTQAPDTEADSDINVRSSRYYVVEGRTTCPRCSGVTPVFAFSLPDDYESRNSIGVPVWVKPRTAALLSYIEYLPATVARHLSAKAPRYQLDLQKDTCRLYWMNHCAQCQSQIEDRTLHEGRNGIFGPMPSEGLNSIKLHEIREAFAAWAGGESHDPNFLDG